MALGDMPQLDAALNRGLDAGLTVSDAKEILVQLYAYTGFPRSLNALGELMKVLDARKQRGMQRPRGPRAGPAFPPAANFWRWGRPTRRSCSGAPVKGPLFEFAPAIDDFLKRHLFGDIFARDNLDWQSRELATVGALAAMPGVESQLLSHIRVSMNVGLTAAQLRQVADVLAEAGQADAARAYPGSPRETPHRQCAVIHAPVLFAQSHILRSDGRRCAGLCGDVFRRRRR